MEVTVTFEVQGIWTSKGPEFWSELVREALLVELPDTKFTVDGSGINTDSIEATTTH